MGLALWVGFEFIEGKVEDIEERELRRARRLV